MMLSHMIINHIGYRHNKYCNFIPNVAVDSSANLMLNNIQYYLIMHAQSAMLLNIYFFEAYRFQKKVNEKTCLMLQGWLIGAFCYKECY